MKYNEVIKRHLAVNKKRTGKKLDFKWITVHNTGNPKNKYNFRKYTVYTPAIILTTGA